jgi:hypothetical protein
MVLHPRTQYSSEFQIQYRSLADSDHGVCFVLLYSCSFRGRCRATGLHATIHFVYYVSVFVGGRSIGIVRSRTQTMEFVCFVLLYSCLFRGRCRATGLHATIRFVYYVSVFVVFTILQYNSGAIYYTTHQKQAVIYVYNQVLRL